MEQKSGLRVGRIQAEEGFVWSTHFLSVSCWEADVSFAGSQEPRPLPFPEQLSLRPDAPVTASVFCAQMGGGGFEAGCGQCRSVFESLSKALYV